MDTNNGKSLRESRGGTSTRGAHRRDCGDALAEEVKCFVLGRRWVGLGGAQDCQVLGCGFEAVDEVRAVNVVTPEGAVGLVEMARDLGEGGEGAVDDAVG